MKTLRILIALCFVLGFSKTAMKAQPPVADITWDIYSDPVTLTTADNGCLTEDILGTFHWQGWWLGMFYQERTTGEFLGQTTGLTYTIEGLLTHHFRYNPHEGNWGGTYNEKLLCGGKMIGTAHWNGLVNWVNDEPHLDISHVHISCK